MVGLESQGNLFATLLLLSFLDVCICVRQTTSYGMILSSIDIAADDDCK